MKKKSTRPGAANAGRSKNGLPNGGTDPGADFTAESKAPHRGSFFAEEAENIARLRAVGWRVVDRKLAFTRHDAEQCHFAGTADWVQSFGREAWVAWQQAAHGVGVLDRPPLVKRLNKIRVPERVFAEVSGQPPAAPWGR